MDLFGEPDIPKEKIVATDLTEPEAPQEAFSHPRAMEFCLGHEATQQHLLDSFKTGRIAHGLIFAGPKGIGKATLAYRLSKTILGQENLVTSGGHPDLMSVERTYDAVKNTYKASVEVAEIRKVTPFLRMTASYAGWRVVIIDDADTMNRNAQNALLKILEEPPENTLLILITHRLGTLIPTIRSRTQLINLKPLEAATMQELLKRAGHDGLTPQRLETLNSLSSGSFGRALQLLEEGGLETLHNITTMLEQYPHWHWPTIHELSDTLGRAGQGKAYDLFADLMVWVFSELILAKAKGQGAHTALDKPAFQALLKNSSLEELLKICENLHAHFDKVSRANLDKRQGVLQAFSLITA